MPRSVAVKDTSSARRSRRVARASRARSLRPTSLLPDTGPTPPARAPAQDVGIPWADPRALIEEAHTDPRTVVVVRACMCRDRTAWGGSLEILHWMLAARRWMLSNEEYAAWVLLLETSEERPSPHEVYRMVRNLGERGLLEVFAAVVWARRPFGDHDVRDPPAGAGSWYRSCVQGHATKPRLQ
jgi:LD-carboxypeptidase